MSRRRVEPVPFHLLIDWYRKELGYCSACGVRREARATQEGYNQRTGRAEWYVQARCPRRRPWNFHDDWQGLIPPPPGQVADLDEDA